MMKALKLTVEIKEKWNTPQGVETLRFEVETPDWYERRLFYEYPLDIDINKSSMVSGFERLFEMAKYSFLDLIKRREEDASYEKNLLEGVLARKRGEQGEQRGEGN